MNVIFILLFTLTLLASVDLKNTTIKHSNDSLRASYSEFESGKRGFELLNLDGTMRKKFLYEVATTDERVSVICSPFSAMMPLGILLFGASNEKTEKELLKSFGLKDKSEARHYFKDLRKKIMRLPEATTRIASKIYFSDKAKIRSAFKQDADDTFDVGCIENIDMSNPAHVADEINKWVLEHTDEKITKIISASDVSPYSVIMVVDTVYFSAQWEYRFIHSQSDTFYGASGQHTIQMMEADNEYVYGTSKTLGAQAILIPYREGKANMLVLLPNSQTGLSSLLHKLKQEPELINGIKMKKTWVKIYMPKFKIETSFDLKVLYEKVGLKEIFTRGLDKVAKDMNVKVDKGIHKAMIDVNELGTTAAAASVIQGYGAGRPMDHVVFKADHPFLFFIIAHKQQLFGGIFVG